MSFSSVATSDPGGALSNFGRWRLRVAVEAKTAHDEVLERHAVLSSAPLC